jgi:hypothetical protein
MPLPSQSCAVARKTDGAGMLPDDDELLTREAVASALTKAGFPVAAKTLATKATRGGGPPYQKFGPRALYRWGPSLQWAKARLSAPMHSTSELDTRVAAG